MERIWRMNTDLFSQKTQNNTEKERKTYLTTETRGAQRNTKKLLITSCSNSLRKPLRSLFSAARNRWPGIAYSWKTLSLYEVVYSKDVVHRT